MPPSALCLVDGWIMGTFQLIVVMIGSGILVLPRALAWLGWVAGIPTIFFITAVTMIAARWLTDVHEVDGRRFGGYREATRTVLGEPTVQTAGILLLPPLSHR